MTLQAQILTNYDGVRNLDMQLIGIADGFDQETNVLKVDLSAVAGSYQAQPSSVKIENLTWSVQCPPGGCVILSWDNTPTPIPFATLSGQGGGPFKYKKIDGLPNQGDAPNGNILLTTSGFEPGSTYTVQLGMVKKYAR